MLVCDEPKEDTDFQYWLDVANLLSGGRPLIIVQNRKQGRAQALNLAVLRQAYPQLCGTHSLDLADNDGLAEAGAKIRKEIESLPHIGTSLPRTWRDVRVELEDNPRDHISTEEFFRIGRANGFTVVRPDAGIYKPLDRLAHVEFWERRKTDLEQAMRRVGQENLQGIRDDLDLYEKIRNTVAGLLDVLRDMNAPQQDAERLAQAIEQRLDRD